ncbi:MAG: Formiminotransferase-cyclodeaminase [Clostridiaceae bacterium]|jgi:formiminotetrahydrofolate cyclodeaminase|nr:Formiminotransferase-cyclodeaminase [Clostridiaceae bacterium]
MLKNLMIKDFIEELSSSSPAPGGGSVAALSAALASSLGSMVFNLTVGKRNYDELGEADKHKIMNSLEKTEKGSEEFLRLMEEDTDSFLQLMSAFRLPKDTEENKKLRVEKIQQGYKAAIEVPLKVASSAFKIYDYILTACELGNSNAISDAGVAALLIETAIEGAVLNVKINLSSVKDEVYKAEIYEKINKLVSEGKQNRDNILNIVESKL